MYELKHRLNHYHYIWVVHITHTYTHACTTLDKIQSDTYQQFILSNNVFFNYAPQSNRLNIALYRMFLLFGLVCQKQWYHCRTKLKRERSESKIDSFDTVHFKLVLNSKFSRCDKAGPFSSIPMPNIKSHFNVV